MPPSAASLGIDRHKRFRIISATPGRPLYKATPLRRHEIAAAAVRRGVTDIGVLGATAEELSWLNVGMPAGVEVHDAESDICVAPPLHQVLSVLSIEAAMEVLRYARHLGLGEFFLDDQDYGYIIYRPEDRQDGGGPFDVFLDGPVWVRLRISEDGDPTVETMGAVPRSVDFS